MPGCSIRTLLGVEIHMMARRRKSTLEDAGFGLVEMVVAFTVLLLVLVATAELTTNIIGQAATTRAQVAATDLADQALTEIGAEPLSQLMPDVNRILTDSPVTLAGQRFTISQYLTWQNTGAPHSLCVTGSPPQVMQATVTVAWGDAHHLAETTVVNPPYGQAQNQDGWLAVLVQSATNPDMPPGDVGAVSITVTPQGASPLPVLSPDSAGCLYQPLAPGTYDVGLSSPSSPAFVDNNNSPDPSQQDVTVTQGQATDLSFLYDQAAAVTFTGSTPSPPLATGMPVTVSNPGMTAGNQVVVPAGSSTSSAGPVNLFPFPTGYLAWFGSCSSEAPGTGWTGASSTAISVTPGQPTTAAAGGLAELDFNVTTTPGTTITTTAALADPNSTACPSQTYGLGTVSAATSTVTVAAQIIPEDYTVKFVAGSASTTLGITWSNGTWVDSASGASYPPSSAIPVSVG